MFRCPGLPGFPDHLIPQAYYLLIPQAGRSPTRRQRFGRLALGTSRLLALARCMAQVSASALPSPVLESPGSDLPSARGHPRTWGAPTCQCFPLCHAGDTLRLFERLPLVINTTASPWYRYLTTVYGGPVQLPFDPRRLQMFYPGLLPTNSHLCRRSPITNWEVGIRDGPGPAELPQCAPAQCVGWLRPHEEVYASFNHKSNVPIRVRDPRYRRKWATSSSHIWTPIQQPWVGEGPLSRGEKTSRLGLAANHLFVGMQPRPRTFFRNHTWVEVIRVGQGSKSGAPPFYGCWFWPLTGSGLWVNIGRTLTVATPRDAGPEVRHDLQFANATVERGFDSMQVMYGQRNLGGIKQRYHMLTGGPTMELILASGRCYSAAPLEKNACAPVPLRAGLRAEQPCECSEEAAPFINCGQAFLTLRKR